MTDDEIKEQERIEHIAQAEAQWQRVIAAIEKLPDHAQEKIIECGMRMRELACYYGPYFTFAMMMTSTEIAAERLLMPKIAECDQQLQLMLPGGMTKEELQAAAEKGRAIIVPFTKTRH